MIESERDTHLTICCKIFLFNLQKNFKHFNAIINVNNVFFLSNLRTFFLITFRRCSSLYLEKFVTHNFYIIIEKYLWIMSRLSRC